MKDDNDRARDRTLPRDPAEGAEPMPKGERTAAAELVRRWDEHGKLAPDMFTKAPPEPQWLLTRGDRSKGKPSKPGAMRLGKVGMLVAAGGIGKTQALVLLAIAVATGGWWFDAFHVATPGRVLLALGEEDPEEVHRRIYSASRMLGLGAAELALVLERIVVLPLAGVPVGLVEKDRVTGNVTTTTVLDALRKKLAEGGDWSLIALDPLSRWAGAETETDNASATRFIEAAETLVTSPGTPAVVLAHHTPKADRNRKPGSGPSTPRGASALYDGARWVATLEALEPSDFGAKEGAPPMPFDVLTLAITKSNYAERGEPLRLTRDRSNGGALRPLIASESASLDGWQKEARATKGRKSDDTRGNSDPTPGLE